MKTGIIRDIDKLGRVVIPKEMRKLLRMDDENGQKKVQVEIFTDGDQIIIKKAAPSCIICGSSKNLNNIKDKFICEDCLNSVSSK